LTVLSDCQNGAPYGCFEKSQIKMKKIRFCADRPGTAKRKSGAWKEKKDGLQQQTAKFNGLAAPEASDKTGKNTLLR